MGIFNLSYIFFVILPFSQALKVLFVGKYPPKFLCLEHKFENQLKCKKININYQYFYCHLI